MIRENDKENNRVSNSLCIFNSIFFHTYISERMSYFRYTQTDEVDINNPIFRVGTAVDNTFTDTQDIGFFGQYYDSVIKYTGLFRDASDGGKYKLFTGLQALPVVSSGSALVNTAGTGYALADLDLQNFHAFGDAIVEGNLTVNGTVTTVNVETLTVEDNIIIANSGPANMKEDGGFVVKRINSNIILDTPKQTGTASAAGTTTTITLQAANGHGTTLDYYKGWIIKFGGDVTGTAEVTSSTAANPPVLTFTPAASGSTTTSTTYELFNQRFRGLIHDESTDYLTMYGFPREDLETTIDPANANGNLADYANFRAATINATTTITAPSITVTGAASFGTITGPVSIDDNILAVNTGPTVTAEDFGYVGKRTAARVAAADTPLLSAVAVQTNYVSGTTLLITNAASGTNYFKGWVITNSVNSEARYITASTNSGSTHTLTLSSGFTTALTAGTDTVNLFNKTHAGWIYDESSDEFSLMGFPREDGETVIDPIAPVNGNIPSYLNLHVNNLTVDGTILSAFAYQTLTQVAAVTFSAATIKTYSVIYLNPSANTTYTLPSIAGLGLTTSTVFVVFVNISASFTATLASSDNFEGSTTIKLNKRWLKVCLFPNIANSTWMIRG
jgi:hypothetical protein